LRGTPGNPMTADEVSAKALDLMAPILALNRETNSSWRSTSSTLRSGVRTRRLLQV